MKKTWTILAGVLMQMCITNAFSASSVTLDGATKFHQWRPHLEKDRVSLDLSNIPVECGIINYTDETVKINTIYIGIEHKALDNGIATGKLVDTGFMVPCEKDCLINSGEYKYVSTGESFLKGINTFFKNYPFPIIQDKAELGKKELETAVKWANSLRCSGHGLSF